MSRKYLARTLSLAVAPVAVLGLMSGPASAAEVFGPKCKHSASSNTCLTIERLDTGNYKVTVGIDIRMSKATGDDIVAAANGNPFLTKIFGSDGPNDKTPLFTIPRPKISTSDEFGLSGDFVVEVPPSSLDEDRGSAEDDVFARVQMGDLRTEPAQIKTFESPEINESF
jgi:hypothetical protein